MKHLLTVLLIGASTFSFAQRGGRAMERFDQDNDERLSKVEVSEAPRLNSQFDEIDANKDGFLTRDELASFHAARKKNKDCDGEGPKGPGKN